MQMCVLQNSQTYGGVGNSVCYEWQESRWCDLSGGRQAPEHRCVKHEIASAREGSGGWAEPLPENMLSIIGRLSHRMLPTEIN